MLDRNGLLTLHAPAGNGQVNDPGDIVALDDALRRIDAYAPPPEYAAEPQRYATAPMIRALERFQEQNGLKIDGYAGPSGPTERAINNRLLAKPRGAGLLFDPPAPIAGTVGNGFDNRPRDVATVQRLLGATGDLPEDPFDRPRGYIDENTTGAIKAFQRKTGLADDGWLAPGGETERALHDAVAGLARAKRGDWLAFAERAGRAQARMIERQDFGTAPDRSAGEAAAVPAIGHDTDNGEVVPANFDWRSYHSMREMLEGGGFYRGLGAGRRRPMPKLVPPPPIVSPAMPRSRDGEEQGGKTEFIPPHVDTSPHRGPDPAKPPLDPKAMRPAPYPARPPLKLPGREEIVPPRRDPRDHIEIHPDQSDWIGQLPIIVENRQGSAPVKALNRALGKPVIGIGQRVFPGAEIVQTGGPTPKEAKDYSEDFDKFRFKEKFGITSNAGGSFKDVSYLFEYNGVKFEVVINTVTTAGPNGAPIWREDRQRAKMVLNARSHTLIIDVDKLKPNETIDWRAWDSFLESRLRYVKKLIDKNVMTKEGFDHRLLDRFNESMKQ